jgi:hypothetical protein
MTSNKQKYLWIRPKLVENSLVLIDDPVSLFRGSALDESVDKIYLLGPEVKLKVTLEPVQNYRLGDEHLNTVRASQYRTPYENRD